MKWRCEPKYLLNCRMKMIVAEEKGAKKQQQQQKKRKFAIVCYVCVWIESNETKWNGMSCNAYKRLHHNSHDLFAFCMLQDFFSFDSFFQDFRLFIDGTEAHWIHFMKKAILQIVTLEIPIFFRKKGKELSLIAFYFTQIKYLYEII